MHTAAITRSPLHNTSFSLLPNRARTGAGQVGALYGVLVLPFILIGAVLYCLVEMRGMQLLIAMAFTLVLLLNLYFFVVRGRNTVEALSLRIDLDEMRLYRNNILLHKSSLDLIQIDQLSWGSRKLPAIELYGTRFPRLRIGHAAEYDFGEENERVHALTDYWISNASEWDQLIRILDTKEPDLV